MPILRPGRPGARRLVPPRVAAAIDPAGGLLPLGLGGQALAAPEDLRRGVVLEAGVGGEASVAAVDPRVGVVPIEGLHATPGPVAATGGPARASAGAAPTAETRRVHAVTRSR